LLISVDIGVINKRYVSKEACVLNLLSSGEVVCWSYFHAKHLPVSGVGANFVKGG
jgi:hypothetical protein